MLDHALFAVSAGIAVISTNLDNLAVLLGLILVMEQRRALVGFAVAQTIVLSLAMTVAVGLNQSGLPFWIGYLGLVPLVFGLRGIWRQFRNAETENTESKGAVTLSGDAVSEPLDRQFRGYDPSAGGLGAFLSCCCVGWRCHCGRGSGRSSGMGGTLRQKPWTSRCPFGSDRSIYHGLRRALYSLQLSHRHAVTAPREHFVSHT